MLQAGHFVVAQRRGEGFAPGFEAGKVVGVEAFGHLVGVVAHAGVGQQKVPDFVGLARGGAAGAPGRGFVPGGFGALLQGGGVVDLMARANEAVAGKELVAKPRHAGGQGLAVVVLLAIDGVEPDGHLGQLDGHGVQVHAEHVAVGQVHAHLLQLLRVLVVGDAGFELGLLALQVSLGQLVDGFVQERGAAHGGLAHGEGEDVVGLFDAAVFLVEQFFEGVLHQALGEHLGGVVAGAFLPVAARQAVDEAAFGVHAQLAAAVFYVVDLFVVFVVVDAAAGDEPGVLQHVGVRVAGAGGAPGVGAVAGVIAAVCVVIAFVVV